MKPTLERMQSSFACFILESRRVETNHTQLDHESIKQKKKKQINEYKKRQKKAGRAYF